ncbi:MAG: hypothetical protein ABL888_09750 [Pirellulaceae bacterium]
MHKKKSRTKIGEKKKTPKGWIAFGSTLLLLTIGVALWNKDRFISSNSVRSGKIQKVALTEIPALKQRLFDLNRGIGAEKTTVRIERYNEQIDICRTILISTKNPSDQEFAKKALLNAHSILFTLDESRKFELPEVQATIDGVINEFYDDKNPEVRSAAQELAFRKHMILLGTRENTEESIGEFIELIKKIAADNLNSVAFVYKIGEICDIYKLVPDKAPVNSRILKVMAQAWDSSTNSSVMEWVSSLRDEAALIDANFYEYFLKTPGGERALSEKVLRILPELFRKDVGSRGLDKLLTMGEQFEMNQWYSEATTLFDAVLNHLANKEVPQKKELVTKANYGLKRLALLGSPIQFSAIDVNDKTWTQADLIGKTTLIVYFDQLADLNRLQKHRDRLLAMGKFGLQVYIVVLSPPKQVDLDLVKTAEKTFTFFVDTRAESDFFKACPISAAPYLLLIDKNGKVADINIAMDRLVKSLEVSAFRSDSK